MQTFFNGKYDTIKKHLELLCLYGCYDKETATALMEISPRSYEGMIAKINTCLINNVRKSRIQRKDIYSFSYDRYSDDYMNFLAISYRLCKSEPNDLYEYIILLQRISDGKANKTTDIEPRKLTELKEYFGVKKNKRSDYSLNTIIDTLSLNNDELMQIYDAVSFYKEKSPYSVPGQFLCEKMASRYHLENKLSFMYNSYDRILNDNAVNIAFEAIRKKAPISFKVFSFNRKKSDNLTYTIFPMKVMYEYYSGRGYLIGYDAQTEKHCSYRLDKICDVSVEKSTYEGELPKADSVLSHCWISSISNSKVTRISVDFCYNADYIKSLVPIGEVTPINKTKCHFEAEIYNYSDIVPFLRQFGDKCTVSEEKSPALYERIKEGWRKALEQYGAI